MNQITRYIQHDETISLYPDQITTINMKSPSTIQCIKLRFVACNCNINEFNLSDYINSYIIQSKRYTTPLKIWKSQSTDGKNVIVHLTLWTNPDKKCEMYGTGVKIFTGNKLASDPSLIYINHEVV